MCPHHIHLNDEKTELQIFRESDGGERHFVSSLKLSYLTEKNFGAISRWLGELLLLDCPEARDALFGSEAGALTLGGRAFEWIQEVIRHNPDGVVDERIAVRLKGVGDTASRRLKYTQILEELRSGDRYEQAALLIRDLIHEHGDDGVSWLITAEHQLAIPELLERAFWSIEQAIALAKESGMFLRESYGVKARIALAMKDNRLLNEAISQMIELGPRKDIIDIGVESDFVERAPEGSIEPQVMEGFRKLYLDYYGRPFAG